MQVSFKVHTVNTVKENVIVTLDTEQVPATIDSTEVEMTSDHYGSLCLRFKGAEAVDAKSLFVIDSVHVWTIA